MNQSSDGFSTSFEPDAEQLVAVAEQPQPERIHREKPVVVTGAAGLVGKRTCTVLTQQGWQVRALVRSAARAAERLGHLKLEIRSGDVRDPDSVRAALKGAGAVVHLAAIAIEKKGESYEDSNTRATRVIVDAARAESVDRIIYMSQNGADSKSAYPFLRSKGIAQDYVTDSSLQWTVLKPSVIFGPEDEFVNVLARLVRLSPGLYPLPGGGKARFQPVAVSDVAAAVAKCLDDDSTIGRVLSLGGPMPLSLREMTERILVAMKASRVLVGVPVAALRPFIALAQAVLPHPPVTTGLLDLLALDNVTPSNDLPALGINPIPFAPEELLYLKNISFGDAIGSLMRRK
ncbi:MAG TPA: NAD(P)H-binding protein [Gemmatimonadaceae bacterium]|nr:NAD(P)H-binding protein [Gemmatimonadaceae bacterium]